ncbi:MAG: sigma-54 dependent transcriptional regulator [Woeseiaceae bacterium]
MAGTASSQGKILILDTDVARTRDLCSRLRFLNYEPVVASPDTSPESISSANNIAVVVGELDSDETNWSASDLKNFQPELPRLCLPKSAANEQGMEGCTSWALDLPLKKSQLTRLLRRAERYQGRERRHRLTGESTSIRQVRQLIEQVADFDTNVLITGQSGTGKELVARTIHDLSERADKPFVPINCGAIPAELLESELFGHKKGAFTGAISDRVGRFELAEGGTLFLDEIGDMSLDMQVKLLRVLQERSFERVGSNKTEACDVRILAATHRDLPAAVTAGDFREDLFYRLNVFPIEMPPLYKRVSDLPQLMRELLIHHDGNKGNDIRVSSGTLRALASYSWPGNIRELSNLVERLAIIKPTGTIQLDDLPEKYREAAPSCNESVNNVAAAMKMSESNLKLQLQSVEQDLIQQAVEASGGIVAKAAKLLKMQRTTLVEKIRKYDIH